MKFYLYAAPLFALAAYFAWTEWYYVSGAIIGFLVGTQAAVWLLFRRVTGRSISLRETEEVSDKIL